jgi:hypothetical protein
MLEVIGSGVFRVLGALVKTRTFIDWLDRHVFYGMPKTVSKDDIDLINGFLRLQGIKVNNVIAAEPIIKSKPYFKCSPVFEKLQLPDVQAKAAGFRREQLTNAREDDPHSFHYQDDSGVLAQINGGAQLHVFVIDRYSSLRALPKEEKQKIYVLGANNLVIDRVKNQFTFHHRDKTAETHPLKMHGFGGGYMPYWNSGESAKGVRRDDRSNIRTTAMRELHEESGLLSLDHSPNFISVIEEHHKSNADGKFGYLTFFYVTLIDKRSEPKGSALNDEGTIIDAIEISKTNLENMILVGKLNGVDVHPQLRAQLFVWIFAGCPGLHIKQRRRFANNKSLQAWRELLQEPPLSQIATEDTA